MNLVKIHFDQCAQDMANDVNMMAAKEEAFFLWFLWQKTKQKNQKKKRKKITKNRVIIVKCKWNREY